MSVGGSGVTEQQQGRAAHGCTAPGGGFHQVLHGFVAGADGTHRVTALAEQPVAAATAFVQESASDQAVEQLQTQIAHLPADGADGIGRIGSRRPPQGIDRLADQPMVTRQLVEDLHAVWVPAYLLVYRQFRQQTGRQKGRSLQDCQTWQWQSGAHIQRQQQKVLSEQHR